MPAITVLITSSIPFIIWRTIFKTLITPQANKNDLFK